MIKTNQTFKIINYSERSVKWRWFEDQITGPRLSWQHISINNSNIPNYIPKHKSLKRIISARNTIKAAYKQPSLVVSHGPRQAFYAANFARFKNREIPHMAFSFSFTTLPTGIQHSLMAKAYKQIDRFLLYSTMEKKLYADYFDLDESKFDMIHWPIQPPNIETVDKPLEKGDYICAIGSQGRDYGVLFKAMEKLPNIRLVVVVQPSNIEGLKIPDNVKVYTNIPWVECNNIIHYSKFMVLPLVHAEVPCGHGSIVSAMFYKKAILITEAITVKDYIESDVTGRFFTHQDDQSLRLEIQKLWESPADIKRIAQNGYEFAYSHCTENNAVEYFNKYLNNKISQINLEHA